MTKQAVIVLHEIYGVNQFIENACENIRNMGFDVCCPNLTGRQPFPYRESQKAYEHFTEKIGFDVYKDIEKLLGELKEKYEKVFIVGFSIGATIAWRCCENTLCDGIVGYYGSRIRDYPELNPVCPTALIFAAEDSFNVDEVILKLKDKQNLKLFKCEAKHGFMDHFSENFSRQCAEQAWETAKELLL